MSQYVDAVIAGGVTFPLPYHDSHSWTIQGGYTSPIQEWVVPTGKANAIVTALGTTTGAGREVQLRFGPINNPTLVQRVIFLGVKGADNPQRRTLLFADVRWYWTRAIMLMDVNQRRRVGGLRLIGDSLETWTPVDTVAYAAWTTANGTAYTWATFTTQVLSYLTLARHGRPVLSYVVDAMSISIPAQPVVETTTDGPGYLGLARAIESVPGAGIYVDLAGTIHVYDRTPGAEKALVATLPKSLMGYGDLVLVDKSNLRPVPSASSWRIYLDYEIECRLTYNESGNGLWGVDKEGNPGHAKDDPFLQPVLQVTDISLTIPAGPWSSIGARTVGQGTWITQDEAFEAWGGLSALGLNLPKLTDAIVAAHWADGGLQHYATASTDVLNNALWAARVNELSARWRTTFRINPYFWDRIRHAWNQRAAILDPTTGGRAPAPVYTNFATWPIFRAPDVTALQYTNPVNTSYPANGLLAQGQPSGFGVQVIDEELGIISIDRSNLSRRPGDQKIIPSPVSAASVALLASGGPGLVGNDATQQTLITNTDNNAPPELGWKLAVVLSLAPGSPNDVRRCYEVQVSTNDAANAAGLSSYSGTGYAPDQEFRSQLSDARIAWSDNPDTVDAILNTLGATDMVDDIGSEDSVTSLTPINLKQELTPLAQAMAAADLLNNQDCYEGTKVVYMNAALVPIGSIERVVHKVTHNRAVTVLHALPKAQPFHAIEMLKGSARSYLLKQIATSR